MLESFCINFDIDIVLGVLNTHYQYGLGFYMQYLAHWPEYFQVAESPNGEIMGYSKFWCDALSLIHIVFRIRDLNPKWKRFFGYENECAYARISFTRDLIPKS